jgi:hypothetical protein
MKIPEQALDKYVKAKIIKPYDISSRERMQHDKDMEQWRMDRDLQ